MSYKIEDYDQNVDDIARIFRWTPDHIRLMARNKEIPCVKRRRQWFFCKKELIKLYNGLTYTPVDQTKENEEIDERRDDEECDIFS